MQKFEIHSLDVWGNEEDGFMVNNAFHTGNHLTLTEGFSDDDLATALRADGTLNEGYIGADLSVEGDPDYMLCIYDASTGEPLWNLDRIAD